MVVQPDILADRIVAMRAGALADQEAGAAGMIAIEGAAEAVIHALAGRDAVIAGKAPDREKMRFVELEALAVLVGNLVGIAASGAGEQAELGLDRQRGIVEPGGERIVPDRRRLRVDAA